MPRFFLDQINEDDIQITGPDAHHIGFSLRMRPGEILTVCADGKDYTCEITQITSDTVYLKATDVQLCAAEPELHVTLFQALPKGEKFEQIIQKTIELGVYEIVPVLTRRCISRPKDKEFTKKLERYNKIAASAAKQAGRGLIPKVAPLVSFHEMQEQLKSFDRVLLLYENGGIHFSETQLPTTGNLAVIIGSEGGFDPEEAEQLQAGGADAIWLGNRILRCETAPMAAMAIIMQLTGNM